MKNVLILFSAALLLTCRCMGASELPTAVHAKIEEQKKIIATWAAEPVIVNAVKAHNAGVPPEQRDLDQAKWAKLTVLDPLVRSFTKNAAGQFLKSKKSNLIVEAFVSDAAGLKVAFMAKTTSWSHQGKPKHEVPMKGECWQGPVEMDESSGQQQLQISVPVLADGRPIGSLVVGLSLSELSK
jgi:hypothetical protein